MSISECTASFNSSDTNRSDAYLNVISPYLNQLRIYCQYLTGSTWDSEDLYQETLLRGYIHYQQKGSFTGVRAFLHKVARNIWIDDYRKYRKRMVQGEIIYLQGAYEDVYHPQIRDIVEWLNVRLPKRYLDMFMLAEMLDYTNQEIADELSSTIPAVKCALHRTRRIVKGGDMKVRAQHQNILTTKKEVDRWVSAIARSTVQRKLM